MNKKILFALLILLAVVVSSGVASASDANFTDSYAIDAESDGQVSSDNADDSLQGQMSGEEILESDDSNALSADSQSDDFIGSQQSVDVSASGSNVVCDSADSSKIDTSKSIASKDVTKYYKGSSKYTATFFDSDGRPLANTNVKITVNKVTYTKRTNAKGVASLAMDLKPGTYKVVALNPVTGYSLTTSFKILSTISAGDISKVYSDGRKFNAMFFKSNGHALAKKTIRFKINAKTYKVKTNAKGVAALSLKTLKKGTYKIISYNADGLTKTNTVKVVKSTTTSLTTSAYTFLKGDSKKIKVKLLNKLGYAPGKGKVIKIKIDGKTYSKKTDGNGVASFKLPSLKKGIHTVKYTFEGDKVYKKSSASDKVVVITSKDPSFKVKSPTTFAYGSPSKFKVAVTAGGVPLYKKTVTFKVDGKTYKKTTDAKGVASVSVKLSMGKHTITYSIAKDSKINGKSKSSTITVKEKRHNGYWLYGEDMKKVSLSDLSSKGVTDIFLNFKAYEICGKAGLESWISTAKTNGINVHLWVQAFYSKASSWVNPVKNGKENAEHFTKKINEVKTYAAIKGLSGIHLDYLRYSGDSSHNNAAYQNSGGTKAISTFTNKVVSAAKSINSNLIISAALMPETSSSAYYYGQDYDALSKSLDVVIPMVYKGNYNAKSSWIATTTKWYVDNSKGAEVWTGIQTYNSDDDATKLSSSDLATDIKSAYDGGASGVILFRYGISNSVNFNSISSTSNAAKTTISLKNVVTGAKNVKTFYEAQGRLPNTVTIGGHEFTSAEFLYVMAQAICQIGSSNGNDIVYRTGIDDATAPSGDNIADKLYKSDYLTVAKNVVNFISANNRVPNFASSGLGNIICYELVDSFSRILAYYGTNNQLPSYVNINYASASSSFAVTGTGLNEKANVKDKSIYLVATDNCQVGNSKIKNLVSSLTSGKTTDLEKAKVIFNYVRDSIGYSYYYDTKYGAVGTYEAKTGNCVDQAHLLIAMYRTAGLAARYVHGTCVFNSGSTIGHVWTQVLIDGMWIVGDPTSKNNALGKITNWNTNSHYIKATYSSLPF